MFQTRIANFLVVGRSKVSVDIPEPGNFQPEGAERLRMDCPAQVYQRSKKAATEKKRRSLCRNLRSFLLHQELYFIRIRLCSNSDFSSAGKDESLESEVIASTISVFLKLISNHPRASARVVLISGFS